MGYLSIKEFIESGKKSLEDKNYWGALSVALALPSMCSRIMFQSDKYKGANRNDGYWHETNDGKIHWHDRKCYVDFCKEAMRVGGFPWDLDSKGEYDSALIAIFGDQFAEALYEFRCDIVHAGAANVYAGNKVICLRFGEHGGVTELTKYRIVSVISLCDILFGHIDRWCFNNRTDNFKCTYVFDDDESFLNYLCNRDKEERFNEFIEKSVQ